VCKCLVAHGDHFYRIAGVPALHKPVKQYTHDIDGRIVEVRIIERFPRLETGYTDNQNRMKDGNVVLKPLLGGIPTRCVTTPRGRNRSATKVVTMMDSLLKGLVE